MPENRVIVWVQNRGDRDKLSLEWHDPITGKRKSKSAGTCNPLEAEKARADLEYELNHGLHRDTSAMSWERFRELFEEEYVAGLRKDTRANYKATLDLFERLCSPRSLRGISERIVSAFAAAMRSTPGRRKGSESMAPSTIKVRLQFLHTALSWAAEQKMLPAVPKFPAVKVPKKDPQPVPLESFERLLLKAEDDPQMQAYLLCGWLAGLRLSEALALQWEPTEAAPYLDLARGHIVLPAGFVKGGRDQWVPLDPELRCVLEALPRHGKRVFRFPGERGELGPGGVSQRVADLAKKAGVKLTMKSLRRGFGCRHAGRVSAHVLQRLLRHASLKTTMDYYANIDVAVEEAIWGPGRVSLRVAAPDNGPQEAPSCDASSTLESPSSLSAS
jgi:integrase